MSGRGNNQKGGRGGRGRGRGSRGGSKGRGGQGRGRGRDRGRGRGRGQGRGLSKKDDGSDGNINETKMQSTLSATAANFEPSETPVVQATSAKDNNVTEKRSSQAKPSKSSEGKGESSKKNKSKQQKGGPKQREREEIFSKSDHKGKDGNDDPKKSENMQQKGKEKSNRNDSKRRVKSTEASDTHQSSGEYDGRKGKMKKQKERKVETTESKAPHKPLLPPNQPQTTNDLSYKRGENITVLHIAEKPSIAQAIAKGLARGETEQAGRGLPTYVFDNPPFPKAPHASKCHHKVTSVAGHVFNVDFPAEYSSWDSVDPAELFQAPVVKKPCKGSVVKHLQDSARGVSFIVLWLDCDREGENIAFEVLDCAMHLMEGGGGSSHYDRVYRAYFSAINPSDIQKAYNALGKPDKNQSLAVDARQELDLKVGVAFSRFQTRYFQGRYGDLDSSVLSYGPCQTPTLGFCVARHIAIETFKPEPFWTLDLGIIKKGRIYRCQWDKGRSFNQNKTQALLKTCLESSPPSMAKILNVVTKEKKQSRVVPMNTVSLLKACSKALGIGPHAAMQTAERLYLSGYLSYPRTESSSYPTSFDIKGALQAQSQDNRWGGYVHNLLIEGHNQSRGGIDMGDHPPITPCRAAGQYELSGDMARVYELVTRHFIASVSKDAIWNSTKVDVAIESLGDKGNFTLRGKQLVSPGFLAVLLHKEYGDEKDESRQLENNDDNEEVQDLPDFNKGDIFPIVSANSTSSKVTVEVSGSRASLTVKEKMTTAPSHLTESELISQMERHGIGTDASIATHIENVLKRNYCELLPGRKMLPSKLGLVLAQGYHLIDSSLVLPEIRAEIEDQCNDIAKGHAVKDDVIYKALAIFEAKFQNFVAQINKMDVLFSSSFSQLKDIGKPFTRCGLTRRYLQYIAGPPARLYNKFTETVYPLPIGGLVKEWTGRKCPVPGCSFELCLYSVGHPERTFPLCPNCFNNPRPEWGKVPGEEDSGASAPVDCEDEAKERQIRRVGGRSLTLECPHPDKHPLIEELTVSPDPDYDGVLTVDPHFGPKWRLVSTRNPTIVYLPKSIEKLTVSDRKDEVLGCRLMRIDFKDGQSPLETNATSYSSCFPTDELLQGLVRVYHGSERTQSSGRGRGGRGRGRDGRGRGRR